MSFHRLCLTTRNATGKVSEGRNKCFRLSMPEAVPPNCQIAFNVTTTWLKQCALLSLSEHTLARIPSTVLNWRVEWRLNFATGCYLVLQCCSVCLFTADDAGKPLKVAGDFQPSHCWNFTSRSGSFTSPFYPLNYPNETECVQTLVGQSSHFGFANTGGCETIGNRPL